MRALNGKAYCKLNRKHRVSISWNANKTFQRTLPLLIQTDFSLRFYYQKSFESWAGLSTQQ